MTTAVMLGLSRISSVAAEAEAAAFGWLSASEYGRLAQMRSERRCREFLAARLALRCLLAAVHGGDPLRDWLLNAPENAPPELLSQSSKSPILLGLSHSGDWLLCAVAPFPVGIDIERVGLARDYAGLSATVCSPTEQSRLAACAPCDVPRQFTTRWVLKEAWLKSRGQGIASRPLRDIETEPQATAGNAWLWQLDDAVLALCLPSGVQAEISWTLSGEEPPEPPQIWRVEAS